MFIYNRQSKKTSLHMAAENGQKEVCRALIKMKADTNATDVVNYFYS